MKDIILILFDQSITDSLVYIFDDKTVRLSVLLLNVIIHLY